MTEIIYTKDISDSWEHWDRDEAVLLIDGKFYADYNHQYAMEAYASDYWKKRHYDLEDISDYADACEHTDDLFRKGKIQGFDVFTAYSKDGCEEQYLISHYRRAFDDSRRAQMSSDYAKKHNYQLGTFCRDEALGGDCWLIDLKN